MVLKGGILGRKCNKEVRMLLFSSEPKHRNVYMVEGGEGLREKRTVS